MSPDRPQLRRKPPGTGLQVFMLRYIAQHSPALRLDMLDAARERGFIGLDQIGRTSVYMTLRRLRVLGCITFDETHARWTGRAPAVKGIPETTARRLRRLAAGDAKAFARQRAEELARLQAQADAALATLRPAGAPPIDPAAFEPWRPKPRLQVTPSMRATLEAILTSPAARAEMSRYSEK